jgi:hypothetical protein
MIRKGKTRFLATEEEKQRRLDICAECPFMTKTLKRCQKCGCMLKWKAALQGAKCPLGKWENEEVK